MAYTEKYVTSAAGGGGDGSIGSPWTLDESIDGVGASGGIAAVAGDRVNVQSDGAYSIGATTAANAGTVSSEIIWRGFNSTPGDLDDQGRNSDGSLDTTNFPAITLTGIWLPKSFNILQSLSITGALASVLVGNTSVDKYGLLKCRVENTLNNASAGAIRIDNYSDVVDCDLICSGTNHSWVVLCDGMTVLLYSRVLGVSSTTRIKIMSGVVAGCTVASTGSTTATGIEIDTAISDSSPSVVVGNTLHNLSKAISTPNALPARRLVVAGNHITDCTEYLDNQYSGTANLSVIEAYNRLRDNTTPRTGIEAITVNEVTTDTGGAETDYNDAGNEDFNLIAGAPGAGAGSNGGDIGAWPAEAASGGGSTVPAGLHSIESGAV